MPSPFVLDTNAYFVLFHRPERPVFHALVRRLADGDDISFYISEITSMEVHSVLGKYRRGSPPQHQKCDREIIAGSGTTRCNNTWVHHGGKRMSRRLFHDIRKLIDDVEEKRGDMKATVIKVDEHVVSEAKRLLMRYADRYRIGSHDALIVGTAIRARVVNNIPITLITFDKALKAVLREESVPVFDPMQGTEEFWEHHT